MQTLSDTHPAIERAHIELLRRAGARKRLALGLRMGEDAIRLSRRELKRLHPDMTDKQIGLAWVKLHYGDDIVRRLEKFLKLRSAA